jgi:hypothetical protein
MPVVASAGKTPKGRRIVVSEVCAHTSRANGRPQKSEDNPLTSRSRFQAVALDRRVDLRLHASFEFALVILNRVKRLGDVAAFNHFLHIVAVGFFGIEEDMNLADAAEKVVEIAHDVLIGAH